MTFFESSSDLPATVESIPTDKTFSGYFSAYAGAIIPPNEWPAKCAFSIFKFSLILSKSKTKSSRLKFLLVTGDLPWPLKSYVITVKFFDSFGTIYLQASSVAPIPFLQK